MKVLIILARYYGDTIIGTKLINYLSTDKQFVIDVLTREQHVSTVDINCKVNAIYTASFPIGDVKNFNFNSAFNLFKKIIKLRKNKYDVVLNNIGDFRENLIGFLINGNKNIGIKWEDSHPFIPHIRRGCGSCVDEFIFIPKEIRNIYEVQEYISKRFVREPIKNISVDVKKNVRTKIGIHPMASQKSKLWQFQNWVKLVDLISTDQNKIVVFCSPSEREEVENVFLPVISKIEVFSKNIDCFLSKLEEIDMFIGLDSFAIHAAYKMNVPKLILLIGANDGTIFAPPNTVVIGGGENCKHFPCRNKPKCIGKDYEYICMSSITVNEVASKISQLTSVCIHSK